MCHFVLQATVIAQKRRFRQKYHGTFKTEQRLTELSGIFRKIVRIIFLYFPIFPAPLDILPLFLL